MFLSVPSWAELSPEQEALLETLPPDQRDALKIKMEDAQRLKEDIDEAFEGEDPLLIERPELDDDYNEIICKECIYGYEFFRFSPSTFAPASSAPVSYEYILGPGDKLKITYYGNEEDVSEAFLSREGTIILPSLGPINLIGLSYAEAISAIKGKVSNELIGTDVSVSLTELRSINIYMLGEAYKPGVYTLSSLSTVTNALFITGGVNKNGSLRNIKVRRNNKEIATYDFYEFLLNGSLNSDVKLQDGDVLFVPFIENKVKLGGAFKRPHLYEFVLGETVEDAIDLGGGYASDVRPKASIELSTIDQEDFTRKIIDLLPGDEGFTRALIDGDMLNISSKSGIQSESIKLSGEFQNPGEYSINPGDTILDVINRAGGYTSQAYTEGAIFLREKVAESQKAAFERSADELEKTIIDIITKGALPNISEFTLAPLSALIRRLRDEEPPGRMVVDVDSLKLRTDPIINFRVQNSDSLYVPRRPDSVSVVGEVLNTSTLGFKANLDVFGYIDLAGGLSDSADETKIFVILPNGQSKLVKKTLFSSSNFILPGSTIVVSRDPRPFDAISLTQIITPILADLATSAAAIAAISD